MAKPKERSIPPHEPCQPLAGVHEASVDAELLRRLSDERLARRRGAFELLRRRGMTITESGERPDRSRGQQERRPVKRVSSAQA